VSFTVTVLGTSGRFATLERVCPGYLVDLGDEVIALDLGGGAWTNLLRHVDFRSLDGVVLSHRHPDHTIDLFQLLHARLFAFSEPLEPIPLWAPQETIDRAVAFYSTVTEGFDIRPIRAGDSLEIGTARLSFVQMAHPPETLGVRIEQGGVVLAYSADTGPDADFDTLAGGADVFICEATLQDADEPWSGHLSARQAGELASKVGVKRLVLTHLCYGKDDALSLAQAEAAAGGVAVEIATDNMRIEVGS
jgi:ribonuclease BN (tRNA processing enzyme)